MFCDGTVSKCYKHETAGYDWGVQRNKCWSYGGELVVFETLGEQILVENYFQAKYGSRFNYWIGVSKSYGCAYEEDCWTTVYGTKLYNRSPVSPEGAYPTRGAYAHWCAAAAAAHCPPLPFMWSSSAAHRCP